MADSKTLAELIKTLTLHKEIAAAKRGGGATPNGRYQAGVVDAYAHAIHEIQRAEKYRITERLDYLRGEIVAERISYGEIAELQALAEYIDPADTLLRERAGILEE